MERTFTGRVEEAPQPDSDTAGAVVEPCSFFQVFSQSEWMTIPNEERALLKG